MHGVADPIPEDGTESEEEPAKLRKCSGKRSEEWKILEDIAGDRDKAQEVPTEILLKQAETFGFKQHPYQRTKHSHACSGAPHNADLRSSISSRTAD
jgi:hypothetical protein